MYARNEREKGRQKKKERESKRASNLSHKRIYRIYTGSVFCQMQTECGEYKRDSIIEWLL